MRSVHSEACASLISLCFPTEPANVVLSVEDRTSFVGVSPSGLEVECLMEKSWGGIRATAGVLHGKDVRHLSEQ